MGTWYRQAVKRARAGIIVFAALIFLTGLIGSGRAGPNEDSHEQTVQALAAAGEVNTYALASLYQGSTNYLRILRPSAPAAGETPKAVYVLPVESGTNHSYGDPVEIARAADYHNRFNMTFVEPSFSHTPWYADNWANSGARQESYFVLNVVPAVESLFPELEGRHLLIGFSKSGFGAVSLLMRHSDMFAGAACFDAPLEQETIEMGYGMDWVFSTQANLDEYAMRGAWQRHAGEFPYHTRLWLAGFSGFDADMNWAHATLDSMGIPHVYVRRDYGVPKTGHLWGSGWFGPGLTFLNNIPLLNEDSPRIIFESKIFEEGSTDDGVISNSIGIYLENAVFAVTNGVLTAGTQYQAANVPAGLEMQVEVVDAVTANIRLVGQALRHNHADDEDNVILRFYDPAFNGIRATNVFNSLKTHLQVNFNDPLEPGWKVLAKYDFSHTSRASSDTDSDSRASDLLDGPGLAFGTGLNVGVGSPAPSYLIRSTYTASQEQLSIQNDQYFSFSVADRTGLGLNLDQSTFSFDVAPNDPNASFWWCIRSSVDGFTTNLAMGLERGRSNVFVTRIVGLSGEAFRALSKVTFRIYVFDTIDYPNKALRMDNVALKKPVAHQAQLQIVAMPEGQYQLTWEGVRGRTYSVWRTTGFAHWTAIASGIRTDASGMVIFLHEMQKQNACYRVYDEYQEGPVTITAP